MNARSYWLDLFTWKTWQEFLKAGGEVSGFKESRWRSVQQIKRGDYLLCYLTGISRWIGVLEVASPPYQDNSPVWADEVFPCRVRTKIVASLTPEIAIPVVSLKDQLSMFQNMVSPIAWTGFFRGSPNKMKVSDGEAVTSAILEAKSHPTVRRVDEAKLGYRPRTAKTKLIGDVTIPDDDEAKAEDNRVLVEKEIAKESSAHTEIQELLLRLGSDMGLDIWAARNDRGKEIGGKKLADLPRMKRELPLQFDEATNRTIELIDVLWLKGNAIVAAFEIESTTSVYSGLLRMSDLIAMQPNLNIPLYLVAPDDRRDKVVTEINRPTFSRLSPPMNAICKFIPFARLRHQVSQIGPLVRYLKPDFLDELAESCHIEVS